MAVCVWGPRTDNNELLVLFDAVQALDRDDADQAPAGPRLGDPGVLEQVAGEAGLTPLATGAVAVPCEFADAETVVRAMYFDVELHGLRTTVDEDVIRRAILDAAEPFRRPDGSYGFANRFRWLLAAA